jgi:hypothetical protein
VPLSGDLRNGPAIGADVEQLADRDGQAGLFQELADDRLSQVLTVLDAATGNHPLPDAAPDAAHDLRQQHLSKRMARP